MPIETRPELTFPNFLAVLLVSHSALLIVSEILLVGSAFKYEINGQANVKRCFISNTRIVSKPLVDHTARSH